MIFSAILLGITAVILLKNLLPRRRYKEATIFLAFCVLALSASICYHVISPERSLARVILDLIGKQ